MHGIGHPFAVRSFETFGFAPFQAVPTQKEPDPTFPTVPFPNPEEKGALDVAKAFAEEKGCDVVLANDPDADRLAVAEKDPESGEWTVFTGDQIGSMLGCWLYEMVGKPSGKVSRIGAADKKCVGELALTLDMRTTESVNVRVDCLF